MFSVTIDLRDPELSKRCVLCGKEKRYHLVCHVDLGTENVEYGMLENACPSKLGTRINPIPKFTEAR